jgi:hypothetical protein
VAELLRPHLGRDCTFIGLVYYGAYAHHVGRLMTVCGEAQEAAVHLRGALAHYDAVGALAWSDLARRDLGAATSDDPRSA